MGLKMTSDRDGMTEDGRKVDAGTTVTYVCHPGSQAIRVCLDDNSYAVMHPHCFPELR